MSTFQITAAQIARMKEFINIILPQAGMQGNVREKVSAFTLLNAGVKEFTDVSEEQMNETIDLLEARAPEELVKYIDSSVPSSFELIATPLVERGLKVGPAYPRQKTIHTRLTPDPLNQQSNDPAQIHAWGQQEPNANVVVYAEQKEGGVLFLDKDGDISLVEKYERETGKKFPKTLLVQSSVAENGVPKGHWYFHQTSRTIALDGNIPESKTGGLFSLRVKNYYVVSIGSIHPTTGRPYTVVDDANIAPMPDDFLDWLLAQVTEKHAAATMPSGERRLIPHGQLHGAYMNEAGRLWNAGYDANDVVEMTVKWVLANGEPPIDEAKVRKEARYVTTHYKQGEWSGLTLNQKPDVEEVELPTIVKPPYPVFPDWVMEGTSFYENHVKPTYEANSSSRVKHFMFMPGVVLILNYLATKVKVAYRNLIPSIYLVLIGKKGKVKKSTSINEDIAYLNYIGIASHGSRGLNSADGKTLVLTAASPEYLGKEMNRTNANNAAMLYDELSTLAKKANIENSVMREALLQMYESSKQSNGVKSTKDTYSLEPGTYCVSLIAGSTKSKFTETYAKLASGDDGLDDRFSFHLQPETLERSRPFCSVDTKTNAQATRVLIDKAIQKGVYEITAPELLDEAMANGMSDRDEIRGEKYALYFAVDLGRDSIDEDCIRRGLAIADYEVAVEKYLKVVGGDNKQAILQITVRRLLEDAGGTMGERALERKANASRHGTFLWRNAIDGLLGAGIIRRMGAGKTNDPYRLEVLRVLETDEEE